MVKVLNAGEPDRKIYRTDAQLTVCNAAPCISHVGLRRQQVSDILSFDSQFVAFFHTTLLHFSVRCTCTSIYST